MKISTDITHFCFVKILMLFLFKSVCVMGDVAPCVYHMTTMPVLFYVKLFMCHTHIEL